ncbi:MAG: DUF4339 domain-containing protein [Bacteroidales bacterium]|nr:DUF4339 domain-containing protein [Bacteroidales bacterium]
MAQWYILYNGQQVGPMAEDQLLAYDLNPDSQVWSEGMPQWAAAYTIPALMTLINENKTKNGAYVQQPGCPPMADSYQAPTGYKNKTTAGILALLLGGLGIQYFYLGKVGGGFITILLTIVTCGLWEIITFVQGILMLTMSEQDFYRKYVYNQSTFPLF